MATKKKTPKKGKKAARAAALDTKLKLKLLVKENPFREGSKNFSRFAEFRNGVSVGKLLEGGNVKERHIRRAVEKGIVALG